MKPPLLAGIIIPFILLTAQSCIRHDCASDELRYSLIGFSDQDASSIILRRFAKGTNFNTKIDTSIQDIDFKRNNDTLNMVRRVVNMQITSGYDYEFYFPLSGNTYRLTEINEEKTEQKKSFLNNTKELCINPIISLKVNGALVYPPYYNHFYLRK